MAGTLQKLVDFLVSDEDRGNFDRGARMLAAESFPEAAADLARGAVGATREDPMLLLSAIGGGLGGTVAKGAKPFGQTLMRLAGAGGGAYAGSRLASPRAAAAAEAIELELPAEESPRGRTITREMVQQAMGKGGKALSMGPADVLAEDVGRSFSKQPGKGKSAAAARTGGKTTEEISAEEELDVARRRAAGERNPEKLRMLRDKAKSAQETKSELVKQRATQKTAADKESRDALGDLAKRANEIEMKLRGDADIATSYPELTTKEGKVDPDRVRKYAAGLAAQEYHYRTGTIPEEGETRAAAGETKAAGGETKPAKDKTKLSQENIDQETSAQSTAALVTLGALVLTPLGRAWMKKNPAVIKKLTGGTSAAASIATEGGKKAGGKLSTLLSRKKAGPAFKETELEKLVTPEATQARLIKSMRGSPFPAPRLALPAPRGTPSVQVLPGGPPIQLPRRIDSRLLGEVESSPYADQLIRELLGG